MKWGGKQMHGSREKKTKKRNCDIDTKYLAPFFWFKTAVWKKKKKMRMYR